MVDSLNHFVQVAARIQGQDQGPRSSSDPEGFNQGFQFFIGFLFLQRRSLGAAEDPLQG
jgi:hypothetical protein